MNRNVGLKKWLIAVAVLLLGAAGSASAESVPINVSLEPGQTLYIRFALTDMTNFPDPFNMLGTDFLFDQSYSSFSAHFALYDDADDVLATRDVSDVSGFGVGPTYSDVSRGGRSGAGYSQADLSSYDDGMGMASYANTGGPTIVVSTFEPRFGQATQFGAWYPTMPYIYNFAVDELPPAIPEPATLILLLLGGLTLIRRKMK